MIIIVILTNYFYVGFQMSKRKYNSGSKFTKPLSSYESMRLKTMLILSLEKGKEKDQVPPPNKAFFW